jgi:hypothetical protein
MPKQQLDLFQFAAGSTTGTVHMMHAVVVPGVPAVGYRNRSVVLLLGTSGLPLKHNINIAVLDYRIREYFLRLLNPTSAA